MFMRQLLFITLMLTVLTIGPIRGEFDTKTSEDHIQMDVTISELKDKVRNIQSKADINSYLGENYQVIRGEMYNNIVWRFDMYHVTSYKYTSEYDRIDMGGLQEGLVKYLVFISFDGDGNTVISKSIYYCDSSGNVREVKYIENTEREDVISSR